MPFSDMLLDNAGLCSKITGKEVLDAFEDCSCCGTDESFEAVEEDNGDESMADELRLIIEEWT